MWWIGESNRVQFNGFFDNTTEIIHLIKQGPRRECKLRVQGQEENIPLESVQGQEESTQITDGGTLINKPTSWREKAHTGDFGARLYTENDAPYKTPPKQTTHGSCIHTSRDAAPNGRLDVTRKL